MMKYHQCKKEDSQNERINSRTQVNGNDDG